MSMEVRVPAYFLCRVIKSQKTNSRQAVLRQPSVIDNEVPIEYSPHSIAIIIKLFSNSPFSLIVHLMTLFPLVDY